MENLKYFQFLSDVVICLLWCGMLIYTNGCRGGQQESPNNTKPMYGEVAKSEEYQKMDRDFIAGAVAECGTVDSAARTYVQWGWYYFHSDSLQVAMKRFNQAWLLNPELPDIYFGFAGLEDMRRDSVEAERFYSMAAAKDAGHDRAPICLKKVAECEEELHNAGGTLAAYRKLAKLRPQEQFFFKKIGYFEEVLHNPAAALEANMVAVRLDTNDAMAYMNRGWDYYMLNRYPEALQDYSKALKLDPHNIRIWVNRSNLENVMGDYDAAKKDMEVAVGIVSNDGTLWRSLGLIKWKLKDTVGALTDFVHASKLGVKVSPDQLK